MNIPLVHVSEPQWAAKLRRFSVQPEDLPDAIFASVGRSVLRDLGLVCITFRLLNKICDANFLAWITAKTAHTMPDYKKHVKKA